MEAIVAVPKAQSAQRPSATKPRPAWVTMRTRRRSYRSARIPPGVFAAMPTNMEVNAVTPNQVVELVMS